MRKLGLVCVVVFLGCGSSSNNGPCTPGAAECVNDMIARVCAPDSTWISEPCQAGSTCMAGGCVAKTDVACKPTDSTCMDSTHALVCNTNGVGFMSVDCPTGTVCQGLGLCVGTCIVGSSKCIGTGGVATCTDGFTFTEAACMPGMTSCVTTSATGAAVPTVACQPMQCPTAGSTVCGNKSTDANNTDPNFASTCVASPQGLHWQVEQCAVAGSCSPGVGCSPTCVPGAMRCAPTNIGTQTCGTDGKWGAAMTCTPSASGQLQMCMTVSGAPVCGDLVCFSNTGACESDGFHPCVNGKVSATAMACTTGVCVATGAPSNATGGFTPGSCQAQCASGDQKCVGTAGTTVSYQTCVNGRWSSTTSTCATNKCVQYTDPATGGSRTVCGVCAPGSHRCTDNTGTPGGVTDIETCDGTGNWGTHTACNVGQCTPSGGDAFCGAQCVPGTTLCVGTAPVAPSVPAHPGTIAAVVCTAGGLIPAVPLATDCSGGTPPASCCAAGTSCRKGPSGQAVGTGVAACVQCVGGNIAGGNEIGLVDSMCTDATHDEVCGTDNKWPASPTACTTSCVPEAVGGTCVNCFGTAPFACSASAFVAHGLAPCGTAACGSTSDCCVGDCAGTGTPAPAVCQ
jgi:hypothetical protein